MPAAGIKRKAAPMLGAKLQRRVRPRFEAEPDSDIEEGSSDEAPSEEEGGGFHTGTDTEEEDEDEEGSEGGSDDDSDAPSEHGGAGIDASQLSFGTLARAQASLGALKKKKKKSKGGDDEDSEEDSDKDEPNWKTEIEKGMKAKAEKHHRTSKHAPVEMTSKKPVSRRRDFLANEPAKPKARDPRFGPPGIGSTSKGVIDEIKARKAYSFLDDYQEDEMKQLRAAIKKAKDPNENEQLQKALMSMESKKKARLRKDKERELLSEHKKKEKELIKQGKTPFYLKKSEQKKKLLVDQFASMKKSQVDKAIERKRKKIAGKEKKALPLARRTAEDR